MDNKRYIGNSVYVQFDGYGLVLTTENGIRVTNEITLEPAVYKALTEFVADLQARKENAFTTP